MILMKDIVREGHSALREVASSVELPVSEENQALLDDMMTFLKNSQDEEIAEKYELRSGVGLAAPQLGICKRMIVVHFTDAKNKQHSYKLVNPKITSHSVEQAYLAGGEGCLSVDRAVEGYVPRYARITVKAYDETGNPLKLRFRDYAAIVIQHEIDHLDGVMFYDHINLDNPYQIPENAKEVD
ncbi:Peptide deformylase [Lentibacillus sp. JNUCC-1]|uniref:peptide deformylase n=1 Tax=Lentibacillus sp. JNUCC-1 TaxID=2654513 RepID=UPI0012E78B57|nr:peptide deformylase [Lentibacillus sp. JNUCC-1]MUV36277.1 Peptide deformylase [Lentibacillus sp. JNUCC-1]